MVIEKIYDNIFTQITAFSRFLASLRNNSPRHTFLRQFGRKEKGIKTK